MAAAVAAWWLASPVQTAPGPANVLVLVTLREQPAAELATLEAASSVPVAPPQEALARDEVAARRVARLMRRARHRVPAVQATVMRRVAALGGEVIYVGQAYNALAVRVPVSAMASLRGLPEVASVEVDVPRVAQLGLVSQAMLTSAFWTNGIAGGAVDVAVIDTGVYVGHEAYLPRQASVPGAVFHRAARTRQDYYDVPDNPDDYAGHGTFVGGMIFSQGAAVAPARKGVAYGLDKLYNLKAGYAVYPSGGSSLLSDLLEAVDWALAQPDPPEVFNYSYGARVLTGDDSYTRFWDGVVDTFGTTATISAGNSGPADGTVGSPAIAYNVISVANAWHRGTSTRTDDVIASSSSRGPSPDGRKKPDIAAPGTAIWLPSHYGPFTWLQASGTSFSAPAVAGTAALLIDAGVTDPRAVKAVLLNSSDDLGPPGWDTSSGWGYLNGERAWAERSAYALGSYGAPGTGTARRFFERTTAAPTRATLVWHRHLTYVPGQGSPETGTLNDLDLLLYATATNQLRAASTSAIDNVEQVTSTLAEPAVLVVQSKGAFTGQAEVAALAWGSGFVERAGPALEVSLAVPGTVAPGAEFSLAATLTNGGDLRGHGYALALTLPSGFALVSGAADRTVGSLEPNEQATVTWLVRAPAAPTPARLLSVRGSMSSYGVTGSASASAAVTTALGCSYDVQAPSLVPAAGGEVRVDVAADPGCQWSATSGAGWLPLTGGSPGLGPGQVTFLAQPNPLTEPRSCTVHVAGAAIVVSQAAADPPLPRRYYLAEGATGPLFDLDVLVANPTSQPAPIRATFLRPSGAPVLHELEVAPFSRTTIHVNAIAELATGDVSTVIESLAGVPLVVERTMTWDADGYGGHTGVAVEGPSRVWYFAEGAQGFFDTYLLLANASASAASVEVTWLREGEAPVTTSVVVAAASRHTIYAGSIPELVGRSFSIVVRSDTPLIAERAMYWSDATTFWVGGHESAGVTDLATRWLHAEGATGEYFDTYLLLGNPNDQPARATVTYLLPTGATIVREHVVGPMARLTIYVADEDPGLTATAVSATVTSDLPIVSERAMYWPGPAPRWQEAHNSFGVTADGVKWGLAEGCQGGARNAHTYILLANPGSTLAEVRVSFLPETGAPVVKQFSVPGTSRFNVQVASAAPELAGRCFGALIESTNGVPIVVERAMYWDARGVTWAGGTNATAMPLP